MSLHYDSKTDLWTCTDCKRSVCKYNNQITHHCYNPPPPVVVALKYPLLEKCPKCKRESQGFGNFYYCSDKPACLHVSMYCAYKDCLAPWRNEEVPPE